MMAVGATVATAISGVFRNIFGTKVTVVLVAIPTTIGWLLIILSQNSEMVKVVKLIETQVQSQFFSLWQAGSSVDLLLDRTESCCRFTSEKLHRRKSVEVC